MKKTKYAIGLVLGFIAALIPLGYLLFKRQLEGLPPAALYALIPIEIIVALLAVYLLVASSRSKT